MLTPGGLIFLIWEITGDWGRGQGRAEDNLQPFGGRQARTEAGMKK